MGSARCRCLDSLRLIHCALEVPPGQSALLSAPALRVMGCRRRNFLQGSPLEASHASGKWVPRQAVQTHVTVSLSAAAPSVPVSLHQDWWLPVTPLYHWRCAEPAALQRPTCGLLGASSRLMPSLSRIWQRRRRGQGPQPQVSLSRGLSNRIADKSCLRAEVATNRKGVLFACEW